MSFQWFPGHMHKTRKEIARAIADIDVVLEVLDARLPHSSSNPLVEQLSGGKPLLKVLNKADLADAGRTRKWLRYFLSTTEFSSTTESSSTPGSSNTEIASHAAAGRKNTADGAEKAAGSRAVMTMRQGDRGALRELVAALQALAPSRHAAGRPVRVMVMGIPNVGKSTLINSLLGRRIARVGDEPAVTRRQERFVARDGLAVFDTPGILWPKIEDRDSSYRLAVSGAIRDTVVEHEEAALYALDFLLKDYPQLLCDRYDLARVPDSPESALEAVGRRRGCLRTGGQVDRHKAALILIDELRSGQMGRLSFETLGEWRQKWARAEHDRAFADADEKPSGG